MNIQIFGTTKCFDTKKAQRVFAETLFRGFKKEEIDTMKEFFERAFANAENYFEEKKKCR